jgi:hypothetical protein
MQQPFLHRGLPSTQQHHSIMAVFTHDIVPDGDLYIVLEDANTLCTIPSVSLRYLNIDPPEYKPDPSVVNLPETSSGLELPKVQSKIILTNKIKN